MSDEKKGEQELSHLKNNSENSQSSGRKINKHHEKYEVTIIILTK